jgi:hypothetical protein
MHICLDCQIESTADMCHECGTFTGVIDIIDEDVSIILRYYRRFKTLPKRLKRRYADTSYYIVYNQMEENT